MKKAVRILFFAATMVVTSQCGSDDDVGGGGGGTGTGTGCPTTANCGCSGKKKDDCGGSCCKWVTGSGCKCS